MLHLVLSCFPNAPHSLGWRFRCPVLPEAAHSSRICIQMRDEGGDQVLFSSYYIPCVRQEGEKNEQIRPHSSITGGKTKAEIGRKNLILTDDNFWPSQWPHYLYRNKAFRSHLSQLPCFTEGGTDEQGERASPPEPPSLLNCEVMLQLLGLSFSLFLSLVTV